MIFAGVGLSTETSTARAAREAAERAVASLPGKRADFAVVFATAEHGDALAAHAPLGRLGDDEDLKGLCVLYASDAGKHITGQWLAVDGGVSIVRGG